MLKKTHGSSGDLLGQLRANSSAMPAVLQDDELMTYLQKNKRLKQENIGDLLSMMTPTDQRIAK